MSKPKDEYGRPVDHWLQGKDKVRDIVNTNKKR